MRIKRTTPYFSALLLTGVLFGMWITYLNYIDFFKAAF